MLKLTEEQEKRLDVLFEQYHSKKLMPATYQYYKYFLAFELALERQAFARELIAVFEDGVSEAWRPHEIVDCISQAAGLDQSHTSHEA